MLKCPTCGHDVTEASNFCPHCGASLAKVSGDTTRVIGSVSDEIRFEDLNPEDREAIDALPEGSALLLVPRGTNAGARYLLDVDVTTAGRHPRCDIFLDDITVSRHHARFAWRDGEVWMSDEGSLNGSYVNRVLIEQPVALRRGDEVQIGKFRMVFFAGTAGQG